MPKDNSAAREFSLHADSEKLSRQVLFDSPAAESANGETRRTSLPKMENDFFFLPAPNSNLFLGLAYPQSSPRTSRCDIDAHGQYVMYFRRFDSLGFVLLTVRWPAIGIECTRTHQSHVRCIQRDTIQIHTSMTEGRVCLLVLSTCPDAAIGADDFDLAVDEFHAHMWYCRTQTMILSVFAAFSDDQDSD